MFQIITTNTLPDLSIRDKQSVSVPCFYLTNDNSSTSISNFAPMFNIESISHSYESEENEVVDIEDFSYVLSTIPSEYQMLEININDLQPLDDISTLYINGVYYQNLLEVENLVLVVSENDKVSLEERESLPKI